jgi:hypothetical protein
VRHVEIPFQQYKTPPKPLLCEVSFQFNRMNTQEIDIKPDLVARDVASPEPVKNVSNLDAAARFIAEHGTSTDITPEESSRVRRKVRR